MKTRSVIVTNVVDRMSHSGIRKCYTKRCGKRDLSRRRFPCNSIIRAYKPRHRSHRGYACCFISHYFNWSCIPKFVSNFTFNSYTFTFHCYEPAGATGLNISQISPSVILSLTSRPFLKIKVRRYSCLIELRTYQVLKTLPLLSCCQQRRLLKRTTSLSVTALFGDMAVVEGGSKSQPLRMYSFSPPIPVVKTRGKIFLQARKCEKKKRGTWFAVCKLTTTLRETRVWEKGYH